MPHIIVTGFYPTHKIAETVKAYFQMKKKFPPEEFPGEMNIDAASTATEKGVKVITVYTVTEENLGKALTRVMEMMVGFQLIEGFEYSIDFFATIEEGLASVGMKMPE